MLLTEFIDAPAIRTNLAVRNKRALIQSIAKIASHRLGRDAGEIVEAIAERERLGSTGFGGGVAIPHGKIDGLDKVYGLVVHLEEPVDYDAIDKMPVDIVFMLLSSPDAGAEHLRALAAISRVVRHGSAIDQMRGARSKEALEALLLSADDRISA
ncbi:PTS sugar transporter subunit IIA [Sphingomicrobium flavum]|uniref:PTS sugar transporter subunit IIA n=1 Tax=Sphingomicrobium flavum TaxID=1229164 RepID=UPI0021AD71B8|nr:PTS sugar transporter subunit IIA [Sphingomicrobium flavum]